MLARKWRPTRFEDLVGQDHVARTLANAISSGRIAHAFLFTGVRGVGKTTSARLLARALNCMGTEGAPTTGATATPCLQCPACREITAGSDVDVREIDGASYNGVDEVRKLQDGLPYRPSRDRYKIYIVDEVHMLSTNAWNAFLKTLEEPPAHVKFIFATTEAHKVPATILSRVQRFDFRLIPARLIVERLKTVLEQEGVAAEERALSVIAHQAAGSMRDAMSLLDQVLGYNDRALDEQNVARVLGVAGRKVLHELAFSLVGADAAECLRIVGQIANQGFDLSYFARDFLSLLRDLVVAQVCEAPGELIDLPDEEQAEVKALSQRTGSDDLIRLYNGFSSGFDDIVRSGQPRAALEMLLVRLARRPPLIPLDVLVTRLTNLEHRLSMPTAAGQRAEASSAPLPRAPVRSSSAAASSARPRSRENRTPASKARREGSDESDDPSSPSSTPAPDEPNRSDIDPGLRGQRASEPLDGAEATRSVSSAMSEDELLDFWQDLIERIAGQRPDVAASLEHATLLSREADRLEIAWPPHSVLGSQSSDELVTGLVSQAYREMVGCLPGVSIVRDCEAVANRRTLAAREVAERSRLRRLAQARVRNHPLVTAAVEVLGARIKDVKVVEP